MPLDSLKQSIIDNLSRNKSEPYQPYLVYGGISYTKENVIWEISNDTKLGNELIENLIALTIDLIDRKKLQQ